MTKSGKIVCTARGTHKSRTLATYSAHDDGFVISSKMPVLSGDAVSYYQRGGPTGAGLARVRLRCPSCPIDMQVRSELLLAFLLQENSSGATRRDLSMLQAVI